MKKYILTLIACIAMFTANAEIKYINIYKSGDLVNRFLLSNIDSITFHPYHVTDLYLPDSVNLYLPSNKLFSANDVYYMYYSATMLGNAEPAYATDTAYWQVEDSTIVSIEPYLPNRSLTATYLTLPIMVRALQEGETNLFLRINGITKKINVKVAIAPYVEEQLPADTLLEKIYSRLDQTGNMHPDGNCDFYDIIDEGLTSLNRTIFELNEFPADLEAWNWADVGVADLQNNDWTSDNSLIYGVFCRLYYNIKLCNDYLNIEGTSLQNRAEVRFMRAYFYYQLMDLFGNAPIIKTTDDWSNPVNSTRAELYQFVVTELLAAEADLAKPQQAAQYHADKAAAWLLLSRIYLNAEIYAGKADYENAAAYAKKVIDSSYEIVDNYQSLFLGDNDKNGAEKEIIFAIRQQGSERLSWGGSRFLVSAHASRSLPSVGTSDIWECIRAKVALPLLFFPNAQEYTFSQNDIDKQQTIIDNVGAAGSSDVLSRAANDSRVLLCNYYASATDYSIFAAQLNKVYDSETNGNSTLGWTIRKWNGIYSDGSYGTSPDFPDTDVPVFRKAEAYLNYAEALLRQGSKSNESAEMFNVLRKRAGADTIDIQYLTLQDILDERGREFYSEGIRRTDLVRFGKFRTGDEAYRNIYPIPAAIINKCPQMKQNEGY